MKQAKDFNGENILEVWDYRLSTATPALVRDLKTGTWRIEIHAKDAPDFDGQPGSTPAAPLQSYDTGITVDPNDYDDPAKIAECYAWLHGVRDKYSRPDIEELKPAVAAINVADHELSMLNAELVIAQGGDPLASSDEIYRLKGQIADKVVANNVLAKQVLAHAQENFQKRTGAEGK